MIDMEPVTIEYTKGIKPHPMTTGVGQLLYNTTDDLLYTTGLHNEILTINERGSWAAKAGTRAWVSAGVADYEKSIQSGTMFDNSQSDRVIIKKTGQYRLVYYQRSDGTEASPYGYVTINGSRSQAEDNPNGVFYHDHAADATNTSTFSSYIGLLKAGDWVSGGGSVATGLVLSSSDWSGNLTITRL